MINVKEQNGCFLAHFERIEKSGDAVSPAWLLPIRKAAIARFAELGFPTTKDEDWQYTNVTPIARGDFNQPVRGEARISPDDLSPFLWQGAGITTLVFVNGFFAEEFSDLKTLPKGATIGNLAGRIENDSALLQCHLARHAAIDENAFAALNTSLMQDGAVVHVEKGVIVEAPIHCLFVTVGGGERPVASHPRVLIVAEANSQVSVAETHAGWGGTYFSNAVTEIVAGENAVVDHYCVEREHVDAFHIGTIQIHQSRSSNAASQVVTMDGGLVRHDINTTLDGEGANCNLRGMYVVDGKRHVDNHLRVDHAAPHCDSREFFKGILQDFGRGIFSGKIMVREGAQKTDAKQTNMTLLLSRDAQVESKPQLEILADDVKCTHGATIGQVNEEALFYLRTRGLSTEAARSLLIYAFARESIGEVKIDPLRRQLDELLLDRLPHGDMLREVT